MVLGQMRHRTKGSNMLEVTAKPSTCTRSQHAFAGGVQVPDPSGVWTKCHHCQAMRRFVHTPHPRKGQVTSAQYALAEISHERR